MSRCLAVVVGLSALLHGAVAVAGHPTYRHVRLLEPKWSSGHPSTLTLRLGFESTDDTPQATKLAPQMQLWDLTAGAQVGFDLTEEPQSQYYSVEMTMTPKLPLKSGHDYGVRAGPGSGYTSIYLGIGGELGMTGSNGEVGYLHVGSRPRVWELYFKGGKTLYLRFSEPVVPKTVEGAVSLTNTKTKQTITATGYGPADPTHDFTLTLDGSKIDITVEHTLRIAKKVTSPVGAGLDGGATPQGKPAQDFVLALSPAQLDVFVNGYPRKEDLGIRCHDAVNWWDAASDRPTIPSSVCVQVKPPLPAGGGSGGCATSRTGAVTGVDGLLVLLWVGLLLRPRRR